MKESFLKRIDTTLWEILRGSSVVFTMKVAGAGLAFAFSVLLARLLGAEGAGAYFLSLTVLTIGSMVGRLGLDEVLVRRVAADADQNRWEKVRNVYRAGMSTAAASGCIVGIGLFLTSSWIAEYGFGNPDLAGPIALMGIAVVPLVLSRLYSQILKALKRFVVFALIRKQGILIPGFSIIGTFVLCGVLEWGVTGAVWAFVGGSVAALFVGDYTWRQTLQTETSLRAPLFFRELTGISWTSVASLTDASINLFWVEALGFLRNKFGLLLLGVWASESEVGIYGVALRVALLTSFIQVAINSIVSPKIASLYERNRREELERVARYAVQLSTLLATPPLLLFTLFPDLVLWLFGSEFTAGAGPLMVLAVAQFINVSTGPVGYLLIMTGRAKQMRNVDILATGVGLVLYLTLIPGYGAVGAAIAYGTAITVRYLGAGLTVFRNLDIILFGPFDILTELLKYKKR